MLVAIGEMEKLKVRFNGSSAGVCAWQAQRLAQLALIARQRRCLAATGENTTEIMLLAAAALAAQWRWQRKWQQPTCLATAWKAQSYREITGVKGG